MATVSLLHLVKKVDIHFLHDGLKYHPPILKTLFISIN
jgi:hypothetical protein